MMAMTTSNSINVKPAILSRRTAFIVSPDPTNSDCGVLVFITSLSVVMRGWTPAKKGILCRFCQNSAVGCVTVFRRARPGLGSVVFPAIAPELFDECDQFPALFLGRALSEARHGRAVESGDE